MVPDRHKIFYRSFTKKKIRPGAYGLILTSYLSSMSQIRWILGSKLPSPLKPWPMWANFNKILKRRYKATIYSNENQNQGSYGLN